MSAYFEPIYLNEKMVLNCAAYVFKGVAMETETSQSRVSKGNLSVGFKFLSELISPVSLSGERGGEKSETSKTARRYTMGGLHMSLIDTLIEKEYISRNFDVERVPDRDKFVELDVVLRPIDFYSIIEAIKISAPLIIQVLQNFGDKFNAQFFNKNLKADLLKYEALISKVLVDLERDYLKSGQLEMIMIHPETGRQIGVLDVDVNDSDALSVKAKLTDGRFRVIGRVSKHVASDESISLVQRTILSSVLSIVEKFMGAADVDGVKKYKQGMSTARDFAQQICQLSLPGPALRVMAMSICI
ncbi:DUF6414 family protein [Pandoraea communis]|uniref:DUF6414 family protein n=1 Tax=Pandoraea communis TaxID=2508297 RepID=UPI0025A54FF6|nr:hypothetical protein [Pandoraea communis]MDM8359769.1 hypothetical protein [Pandoraea communis]